MELEVIEKGKDGRFYFTPPSFFINQLKRVLKGSIKVKDEEIPTDNFGSSEITTYAFGKVAVSYGYFLREKGIESIRIRTPHYELDERPFAELVWFANVNDNGKSQIVPWGCFHQLLRIVKEED